MNRVETFHSEKEKPRVDFVRRRMDIVACFNCMLGDLFSSARTALRSI